MLGGAKQDKRAGDRVDARVPAQASRTRQSATPSTSPTGFKGFKIGLGKKGDANVGYEFDRDVLFMQLAPRGRRSRADIMFDRGQHLKWDVGHAVKLTKAWEEYGLRWIEEPLEPWDVQGFRQLRSHCTSLVATGERCWTTEQYHRLIATGIVDVIGCDPGRAGGITGFRELIAAVEHAQLWFNAHAGAARSSAQRAWRCRSLASRHLFELKPIDNPMQNELISEPFWHEDGFIGGRTGPGLGIEVDRAVVEKYRISSDERVRVTVVRRLRMAVGQPPDGALDHRRPRFRRRRHRRVRRRPRT